MKLNRMQKIIFAVYILTLVYLFSYLPLVKSFPCGCRFMTQTWIWAEKPLIFDFHMNPNVSGSAALVSWSIDWRRLVPLLLVATIIDLLAFVIFRDKKHGVAK